MKIVVDKSLKLAYTKYTARTTYLQAKSPMLYQSANQKNIYVKQVKHVPKKSIPDDFSVFPQRLNQLMHERKVIKNGKEQSTSQQELAEKLFVKRQTVSLYLTGQSVPDAIQIRRIAQFFNVSADWLLGLSDVRVQDANTQLICKATGLSADVVDLISKVFENNFISFGVHDLINGIVESDYFPTLLKYYAEALTVSFLNTQYLESDGDNEDDGDKIKKHTVSDFLLDESFDGLGTAIYDGAVYVPLNDAQTMYTQALSTIFYALIDEVIKRRSSALEEKINKSSDESSENS